MAVNKDNEFDSLFDDEPTLPAGDDFTFDEFPEETPAAPPTARPAAAPTAAAAESISQRRRTSDDFAPDMDALLITAQSSMIIEGMKLLTKKDYSVKTVQVYSESIKGVDLYIKILQRNPGNYQKLSAIINNDIDCKEVEKLAFKLYRTRFNDEPGTDDQKLRAFEELRVHLLQAYEKAMISTSMQMVKKYYLMSGTLDQEQVSTLTLAGDPGLKSEIARLHQHVKLAVALIKTGDHEITPGLKGRDVNTFLIRATQLMAYYYLILKNHEAEAYFRRLHENYKKYFVMR